MSRLPIAMMIALLFSSQVSAAPTGYDFAFITETIPEGNVYNEPEEWPNQIFSVASSINDNGDLYGFRLTPEGVLKGYALAYRDNPALTNLETEDWIPLSAGASGDFCFGSLCFPQADLAYGIRIYDSGAISGFTNSAADQPVIPDSLPFSEFPGNFVKENNDGIIASTQVNASSQYGVIIHPDGVIQPDNIQWLVAINEHASPQVLGYRGTNGNCFLYGENCTPPEQCDGEDRHQHQTGQGHHAHGNGYGYGHYDCHQSSTTETQAKSTTKQSGTSEDMAFLIQTHLDTNDATLYQVPTTLSATAGQGQVNGIFPLAMNNNQLVVAGTYELQGQQHQNALLLCSFDPGLLDGNNDNVLDCTNNLEPVGDPMSPVTVSTVLGFNLTNAGILTGNFGYTAAGIGIPFLVNLNAINPTPQLLSNLAHNLSGRELNTISDSNQSNELTGYGFADCSREPEAFVMRISATQASELAFIHSTFETNTLVTPQGSVVLQPSVAGGSGVHEFRTQYKTPTDTNWTLLQDWGTNAGTWHSNDYLGEVCFRVQVRDANDHTLSNEQVVRYFVGEEAQGPVATSPTDSWLIAQADDAQLLPAGSIGTTVLLSLLLIARRR